MTLTITRDRASKLDKQIAKLEAELHNPKSFRLIYIKALMRKIDKKKAERASME
jgi:hypothetical protein